jgi:hypothetical protein
MSVSFAGVYVNDQSTDFIVDLLYKKPVNAFTLEPPLFSACRNCRETRHDLGSGKI